MGSAIVKYAAIGCSGMGRRHLHGLAKLRNTRHCNVELAAVCDLNLESARDMANEAESLLGVRPRICGSVAELAASCPDVVAADIATDAGSHLTVALQCLEAGLHVLCEKPLGITVSECRKIVETSRRVGRVLSVAENFRRDPMNRLVKALIADGAIGSPRLMLEASIGGGDKMVQTPWRHMKHTGTVVLDSGVHNADIVRFYLGEVESVVGEGRIHERVRRNAVRTEEEAAKKDKWWRPNASVPEAFEATGEDATYALVRLKSGAICQWTMDRAGHGEARDQRVIHGSRGSIQAPGDRNGRPVALHLDGGVVIQDERILQYAPSYRLNPLAAEFFGGERPWRYDMPFDDIDQALLALQLHELGECVLNGTQPEVSGEEGLAAVALAYAPIESGRLGRAVLLGDVISGAASPHQLEIDAMRAAPRQAVQAAR